MKNFVTGANGFIGRKLIERLLTHQSDEIIALVRDKEPLNEIENVEYIIGDIQELEARGDTLGTSDVVMPSAIYDDSPRGDTNIGKLQTITRFFPVLPKIEVKKSLTYLSKFCAFIEQRIGAPSGSYFLTIENPVRSVTQIMRDQAGRKIWSIYVPGLKFGLYLLSWLYLCLAALLRLEPILTPSRVAKLFSDTSYATHTGDINRTTYNGSNL